MQQIKNGNIEILGDCLIESSRVKSGCVDLILTDLPYGNMKGIKADKYGCFNGGKWDNAINPEKVYEMTNRVLRKNGKMVLFSQQPYTTELIKNAIPNLPHSYNMIWQKDHFANTLLSKKAPVSYYEDVLVFSKRHPKHDSEFTHPLRPYFKKVLGFIGLSLKKINEKLGHRKAEHCFYVDSTQFSLCTEKTYSELIDVFGIDKMEGFKDFSKIKPIDRKYRGDLNEKLNTKYPSTFNLWEGKKHKSNILKYKKDYNGFHPTQKPVLLLEDLIKTFSNKGDLVLDLTAGSFSTAIAALNTSRQYIAIEKEQKYFETGQKRIADWHKKNNESLFKKAV